MKDNVENLVQRAQYGDMEAFGRIVELFQDAVFGAASGVQMNPGHAPAWILTNRHGYGPGMPCFEGIITDWSDEWRRDRNQWTDSTQDDHVQADFVKRCDYPHDEDKPGYMRWAGPTQNLPIATAYHMKVMRQKRKLCWEVDGQIIAETGLADDEQNLIERLVFCNYGKGTGAVFKDLVIRSRILNIDLAWPAADGE